MVTLLVQNQRNSPVWPAIDGDLSRVSDGGVIAGMGMDTCDYQIY